MPQAAWKRARERFCRRHGRAPAILSIAGSDPSGGAGLQGDLATLAVLGAYGMAVPSALTVQGPSGVQSVHTVDSTITAASIASLRREMPIDAIKIGMLYQPSTAKAVARAVADFPAAIVVDPVLAASRGRRLSRQALGNAILEYIAPIATLITPNLDEASALCGYPIVDVEGMCAAALALQSYGFQAVLVKGGHLDGEPIDVLVDVRQEPVLLYGRRRHSPRNHGTGCLLSTSIAFFLGCGLNIEQACARARLRLEHALVSDHLVGRGNGAVPHHGLLFDDFKEG